MTILPESLNMEFRDALAIAEKALGAALTPLEKLNSDRKLVLRCRATASGMSRNVIVRQLLDNDDDSQARQEARFLNEWAGLEFLSEIDCDCAPRIYASDRQNHLLILEDLGDHPPVMDVLQQGTAAEAAAGLEEFLSLLGRMHAMTYKREDQFLAKRHNLHAPELPNDDAKADHRHSIDRLSANLTRLKIPAPAGLAAEIAAYSAAIHDDPAFRVYTHSDAGPHNVMRSMPYRLFDFEFASFRSGLLDATGPRMGFPSAYHGRPSPPDLVRQAEHAYRQNLAATVPAAADDRLFNRALLHACAHWTLQKISFGLDEWLKDYRDGELPPFPEDMIYFARQNLTRLRNFADTCEAFDDLPALREVALGLAERHMAASPDLEPLPLFGAFIHP